MLRRACGRLGLPVSRAARTSASGLASPLPVARRASALPVARRALAARATPSADARGDDHRRRRAWWGGATLPHGLRGLSATSWRSGDETRRDKPVVTAAAAQKDVRNLPVEPERAREVMASLPSICPGCGVGLQCEDKNLPGFFVIPKRLLETPAEDDPDEDGDALDDFADDFDSESESESSDPAVLAKLAEAAEMEALADDDDEEEQFELEDLDLDDEDFADDEPMQDFVIPGDFDDDDFFQDGWLDDLDIKVSDDDTYRPTGDGDDEDEDENASVTSGAGGGGYMNEDDALAAFDSLFDEPEDDRELARRERAARRRDSPDSVVCARCYSLRNYGKVKNDAAEILMPSFDFARVIGDRLDRVGPGGAVVLLVVDIVDFDGSFPVDAVDVLAPYVADETVDVLLVANKVDLLPTQCTRTRVSSFARRRAKDMGLKRASGVHLVSAHTGMGVNILSEQLEQLLAQGKEVWVVGAQNAGKSSIINRLSKRYGGPGPEDGGPLASHLPGTTIGVVRLEDLLPNGSDVFDTPGLLQPFQVASRLNNEEARMVLPRRRLQPRTYRAEIGSTIHIGGLARVDVVDGPQRTMYLTVWVSSDVPTHYMVKGEGGKADALFAKHAGGKLSPPIGEKRVRQLGEWGSRTVSVYGSSWQKSDRDITIGGLGWIGVGVNGNASFRVWTHEGVQVATREALVPDLARDLHRPGFSDEMSVGGSGDTKRPSKKVKRKGTSRAPRRK
jgi:ribosome biogenesis GTPase A